MRELLKLDLEFYQTDSDGILQRTIHSLIMGGKQMLARPGIILDVIRKRSIKALLVPDRKRILIDENLHKAKHRWAEAHEITHDILPWHEHALHGDSELTMKQACIDKVEAEANYGSGQLLFLRDRFTTEVMDSQPTVALVTSLAKSFKNTNASTLWRLVETAGRERPILGVMHYHPAPRFHSAENDPTNPCRHFIRSDAFLSMFSELKEIEIFEHISRYILPKRGGPVGGDIVLLTDDNGQLHEFGFETFNFTRECLTLAVYLRPHSIKVALTA